MYKSDLEAMVGMNESILWRGRPDKKCFILESIFNPMLPFALIWAIIDLAVVGFTFSSAGGMLMFILPFILLHLMPVWIYIGGVIMSFRKHRNTQYIITDKGIYVSGGIFAYKYEMKPFTDLSHINIHRGIFDQWLGVGDVVTVCSHTGYSSNSSHSHSSNGLTICDIPDYQQVFAMVKQLQTDIYADTQFPNDFRPGENHGYQTQYRGRN
ncbi:MAG: PH domain-containing protein [Lachnospiraceae bacterium]|nr:PH domain-containing protein [Lachnospiraceae bacterium]